jgi:hypothetical protein
MTERLLLIDSLIDRTNTTRNQGAQHMTWAPYTIASLISIMTLLYVDLIIFGKIWGFHGGDFKEFLLLEYYAVWLL